jgi:hypothetical protein
MPAQGPGHMGSTFLPSVGVDAVRDAVIEETRPRYGGPGGRLQFAGHARAAMLRRNRSTPLAGFDPHCPMSNVARRVR